MVVPPLILLSLSKTILPSKSVSLMFIFPAIGQNVNRIGKEKNISFQELSFRTNTEKSNLVKLTTQGSNMTLTTLNKIAKGLDVPITEFFSHV